MFLHFCKQASYPGPLWVGATSEWLGDMPTPIEVTQQVEKATNQNTNTDLIAKYMTSRYLEKFGNTRKRKNVTDQQMLGRC